MPDNKSSQISLFDIYEDVNASFTEKKALIIQKLFAFSYDSQLILVLKFSDKPRNFCVFDKTPDYNPYTGVYSMLPETVNADPSARQQYINGHYCYAHKVGIMTDGIGIVRDIVFFDDDFR